MRSSSRRSILAPSERVVVDVLFEQPGELALEHRTPEKTYSLATIAVSDEPASPSLAEAFETLRTAPELAAERERLDRVPGGRARQDARVRRRDGLRRARGAGRLHVPDASGRRQRGAGQLPAVRDEAHAGGDRRTRARCIPRWSARSLAAARVRHEAAPVAHVAQAGGATRARARPPRAWPRPRAGGHAATSTAQGMARATVTTTRPRRHRVGGRHGRGQPDDDAGEHPLEARRPGDGRREPRRSPGSSASATA